MKYEMPNIIVEEWEDDEVFTNDNVHVSIQPDGEGDFDGGDVPDEWW